MTRQIIYTVANGQLTAMTPAAPESEDTMQRLVAEHPEIIADRDGELLLIRREQPIADSEEGGQRWSLDHLFVTREGVPVLVELKRASDTRLRREVVGQMLDYAANATAHWRAGTIAASFAATAEGAGHDPDQLLARFLGETSDPDAFWQQVDANFVAGRIKLVFVADQIPRELARIVEFLNEQMKADVRAVELNWYEGQGVRAFTPRVIGETERAQAAKSASTGPLVPIARDEWIAFHIAPLGAEALAAVDNYISAVEGAGGYVEVSTAQASLIGTLKVHGTSLYPLQFQKNGWVAFALIYLRNRPAFASDEARQALYGRMAQIVGPLSTPSIKGYPAFPATRLNDPAVREGVTALLRDIADAVA